MTTNRYFVIETISEDGKYFLVKGWNIARGYFERTLVPSPNTYFASKYAALNSFKSLLKWMPEYLEGSIYILEVDILGNEIAREQIF